MPKQALFAGLVVDENDQPVEIAYIGDEPCYVVNDQGFRRHIPSETVDRQVLQLFHDTIEGHEEELSSQAAQMLGQEDIFSRALIANQLKNIEKQFDALLETGIPEEGRAYMGLMGLHIKINVHGEVVEVIQPGAIDPNHEE